MALEFIADNTMLVGVVVVVLFSIYYWGLRPIMNQDEPIEPKEVNPEDDPMNILQGLPQADSNDY